MSDRWQSMDLLLGTFWSVTTGLALAQLLFPGNTSIATSQTTWLFVGLQLVTLMLLVVFLTIFRPRLDESLHPQRRAVYAGITSAYMLSLLALAWSAYALVPGFPPQLQYFALMPLGFWALGVVVLPFWSYR